AARVLQAALRIATPGAHSLAVSRTPRPEGTRRGSDHRDVGNPLGAILDDVSPFDEGGHGGLRCAAPGGPSFISDPAGVSRGTGPCCGCPNQPLGMEIKSGASWRRGYQSERGETMIQGSSFREKKVPADHSPQSLDRAARG